jgi:polar amino acid transport system substrate-binding protein
VKSLLTITFSVLLSLVATYALIQNYNNTASTTAAHTESVYDRVIRTGVLRCGYFPSPDFIDIDPNTKVMSGLIYDYVNQLAKNLALKVEWTEEIGRGDFVAALDAERFDIYCTALSVNAERARIVDFTDPYIFDSFSLYVRADDSRFDADVAKINDPTVRIAAKEGDIMEKIARKKFPKAQIILHPQLSSETDPLLDLDGQKADIVLTTPKIAGRYITNNPGKVKQAGPGSPLIYATATKSGEYKLTKMLNLAGKEMQASGQADAIFDKYDPERKIFLRLVKPYETAK